MKECYSNLLRYLFNNSTRGFRIVMMFTSLIFFIMGILDVSGTIVVNLPPITSHHGGFLIILLAFNIFTGLLSFTLDKNNYRKRAKVLMLMGNCIFHLITAMSFYTITPPYDLTIIYALVSVIWTLLAISYVIIIEGLNNGMDT